MAVSVAAPSTTPVFGRGIAITALVCASFYLVMTANLPTFPIYAGMRGASVADIALIAGAMGLVSLLTRPISGWLIDRWTRRTMLAAGIAVFAISTIVVGWAGVVLLLALWRGLQSAAVGMVSAAASTFVSDAAPPARRAESLGYLNAAQTTAGILGPTLGIAILNAPQLLPLNALAVWWPDLRFADKNYAVLFSLFLIVASIGILLTRLIPEVRRTGTPRPFSIRALVDRRTIGPLIVVTFLTSPFAAVLSFLPLFGPERGLENVGLYFTLEAVGFLTAGLTMGRVADRVGRRPVVVALMGLGALAMVLLSLAGTWWIILLAALLSGFTQSGARNAVTAYTADRVPPTERGTALSTVSMGFDAGLTLGSPILGAAAAFWGVAAAFTTGGVLTLIGGVLAIFVLRGHPRPQV